MLSKTVLQPALLPYRDTNNRDIGYVSDPSATKTYDSDLDPLISAPELEEDALMRFTATGRPMPAFRGSGLQNLGGDAYSLPQLLPRRYTDDSIIPAIVVDIIPSSRPARDGEEGMKKGLLGRFKIGKKEEGNEKGITKVVYMPRRDYQRYFARDPKGVYIGSEPYRRWTQEELEEKFAKFAEEMKKRT